MKTFLLSFENHFHNASLSIPNWDYFSASHSRNLKGMFYTTLYTFLKPQVKGEGFKRLQAFHAPSPAESFLEGQWIWSDVEIWQLTMHLFSVLLIGTPSDNATKRGLDEASKEQATKTWVCQFAKCQQAVFLEDIFQNSLQSGQNSLKHSPLRNFFPVLGENGV